MVAADGLRVEVTSDASLSDSLQREWAGLLERSAERCPFLTYEWLSTWWQAFARDERPYLVAIRRGAKLVALAPLSYSTRRVHGRKRSMIRFWTNPYSNRAGFLLNDASRGVLDRLVEHLVTEAPRWDLMDLVPVPQDTGTTRGFVEALARRGIRYGTSQIYRSPRLRLPDSWDRLLQSRSPSFRETLRRKLRNATSRWEVELEMTADPRRFEEILDISRDSWQHARGTSIASSDEVTTFYRRLAQSAAERGWLRLALLKLDGRPVSFEYNLLYDNVAYNLKLGYRQDFRSVSPGLLLQAKVLEHLVEAGVSAYDFLGVDEHYKMHWADSVRPHCHIWVYRSQPDLVAAHFLRYRLRPFVKQHLPWLVRLRRGLRSLGRTRN